MNNFGRITKMKMTVLPVRAFPRRSVHFFSSEKKHHFFRCNNHLFILTVVVLTSGGELIHHLIPNLEDQYASFSLVPSPLICPTTEEPYQGRPRCYRRYIRIFRRYKPSRPRKPSARWKYSEEDLLIT